MPDASYGAGRPRAVADVPPAALADGQAPAKGWLLRLVAARPLQDAPAVPTAELVREAPALCVAILRAVGSEAEVGRLQADGDLAPLAARAGALAGAGSAPAAVAAVGQLRAALWDALAATLAPLDAASTAALAERLAFVCDLVAVATVGGAGRAGEVVALRVRDTRGEGEEGRAPAPLQAVAERPDADWRGAAEAHAREARPFALLVLEVEDAQRLLAADDEATAAGALARVEAAVRGELRPGDVMAREPDGRMWVVAAELGATGGRALAERLADAVAAAATLRGAPLSASIGLAASPADGTALDTLAAQADEALFAARAAGVPIA